MTSVFSNNFTGTAGTTIVGYPAGTKVWQNGEASNGASWSPTFSDPPKICDAGVGMCRYDFTQWGAAGRVPIDSSLFDDDVTISFRTSNGVFENGVELVIAIGIAGNPQSYLSVALDGRSSTHDYRVSSSSTGVTGVGHDGGLFEIIIKKPTAGTTRAVVVNYGGIAIITSGSVPDAPPAGSFLSFRVMAGKTTGARLNEITLSALALVPPTPTGPDALLHDNFSGTGGIVGRVPDDIHYGSWIASGYFGPPDYAVVSGGSVSSPTGDSWSAVCHLAATEPADVYVEAHVTQTADTSNEYWFGVRSVYTSYWRPGIEFRIAYYSPTQLSLTSYPGYWAAGPNFTVANPLSYKAYIEVQGAEARVYVDDVLIVTLPIDTSTYPSPSGPVFLGGNFSHHKVDYIEVGTLPELPPGPDPTAPFWTGFVGAHETT